MKQISIKGLAEFMAAGPSKQRTVVRRYKYPREDEARAMRIYYREARDVVEAHHRRGNGSGWLLDEATRLATLSDYLAGRSRTRLRHNVRGLRAYEAHFAGRPFEVLRGISAPLIFGDVRISVVPDLHVREGKNERVIKLEFGVNPPSDSEVINLGRSFTTTIAAEATRQPYLIPLGDRAESILEGLTDRRETTEAALADLEKLVQEYLDVQAERRSLGLSPSSFALYQALKLSDVGEGERKPLVERLDAVFSKFPEFRESAAQLRTLKAELYKELMPTVGKDRMVKVADALMKARG